MLFYTELESHFFKDSMIPCIIILAPAYPFFKKHFKHPCIQVSSSYSYITTMYKLLYLNEYIKIIFTFNLDF